MKVILTNGKEVTVFSVIGNPTYVQGASRDALTFILQDTSLDEVDNDFISENCETINIIADDGSENIHKGYVIRTELTKKSVVITQATEADPEVAEMRVMVTMAQRTYAEAQMAALIETVDILVMESLMA